MNSQIRNTTVFHLHLISSRLDNNPDGKPVDSYIIQLATVSYAQTVNVCVTTTSDVGVT